MSPVCDHCNDSGHETQTTTPTDVNTDQDSLQDKDREKTLAQALEKDLSNAPWQKESAKGPLEDLGKNHKDTAVRKLKDLAARKLKEKRTA